MAKKNYVKKKIENTQDSGFGKYQEAVGGGGSPKPNNPAQRAPGVNSSYRKSNNDTMQPRTSDGKFTYKSVNGESIDPKYGPSRGKTVNPLLTGGENGIKISDVEQQFSGQSGTYWDKYKDKWYQKGGEIVTTDFKTRVAADAIWNVAKRRYDSVKGEFEMESSVFDQTKRGIKSQDEKAALQKVQATGQEAEVIDKTTGGIKIKPGTVIPKTLPTNKQPQPGAQPTPTPVIPNTPTQQPNQQPTQQQTTTAPNINTTAKLLHTPQQLQAARQILKNYGVDTTNVTDEQLDGIVDDYIDFNATDDTQNNVANNTNQSNNKNDDDQGESDTVKKIRNMGFTE